MPNQIPQTQNAKPQLERLAAQRSLYSRVKNLAGVQAILSVPLAMAISVAANLIAALKPWAALWGLVIAGIDVALLDTLQSSERTDAAKIQESFDCAVLELPWNSVVTGSRPDPERIAQAAQRYRPDPKHPIENWYPEDVGKLPISSGRLVCQRTNVWWDSQLRKRYGVVLAITGGVLATGSLITGLVRHYSLEDCLLTLWVPLAPAYLWIIREYRKQQAVAKSSEELKDYIEGLWQKMLTSSISEAELKEESRKLQDEIYRRRRDNTPVFDWIFKLLHAMHEVNANKGAAELAREVLGPGAQA